MINITDQRQGAGNFISVPESHIEIVIINNSVITVNGKYVIRTHLNDWMRQDAVWLPQEIDAAKQITKELNNNRKSK